MDLGEGCTGVRTPVGVGQQGCKGGASIAIIAVNAHHYKYSILKREIKRRLNTNQKHSNINKEIVLYYKATRRGLSLKMSMILSMFSFFVKSLSEDSKQSSVSYSSVSLFRR